MRVHDYEGGRESTMHFLLFRNLVDIHYPTLSEFRALILGIKIAHLMSRYLMSIEYCSSRAYLARPLIQPLKTHTLPKQGDYGRRPTKLDTAIGLVNHNEYLGSQNSRK